MVEDSAMVLPFNVKGIWLDSRLLEMVLAWHLCSETLLAIYQVKPESSSELKTLALSKSHPDSKG